MRGGTKTRAPEPAQMDEGLSGSYQTLVERIPGIVYEAVPGEHGRWLYASPQIEPILGYSPAQWCADPALWYERLHPEDRERALADEMRSSETGELLSEYRMVARDGRVIWFQDRASLVKDEARGLEFFQGVLLDVSERKQTELDFRESRAMLAEAQRLAHIGSWDWDVDEDRVSWSEELYRIFGLQPQDFEASFAGYMSHVHPDDRERVTASLEWAGRTGEPFAYESRIVRPDGEIRHLDATGRVILDGGRPVRMFGTAQDVTDRRQIESAARESEAQLRRSHEQVQSIIDNSPLLVYAKDLDLRYLFVNREFVRAFGLDAPAVIGQTDADILPSQLVQGVPAKDRRVLDNGESLQEEEVVVRNGEGRTYLTQRFPLVDSKGDIYAVCAISNDITERKEYEGELRSEIEWSTRLRDAVASDKLVLHAQPILDLRTDLIHQVELLVRMRGSRGREDLILPGEFLPPLERFGLMHEIDRWVVCEAVKLARDRRVEVNLSGQSIGDETLVRLIESHLRSSGVDPGNLVFEITETAAAKDLDAARSFVERLVELGCGFALDDFGTGFGSFNYLKYLPVHYLKIDVEFIRNLAHDQSDQKVVRSLVDVARTFGTKLVAEGVEDEQTLELLRELDVDYAQGFFIGRPAPL